MLVFRRILAVIPLLGQLCLGASQLESVPNQYVAMARIGMEAELFETTLNLVRNILGENHELRRVWSYFDFRGFSFEASAVVADAIRAVPGVELVQPNYSHHKPHQKRDPYPRRHFDPTLYALDRVSHRVNKNRRTGPSPAYAYNLPAGKTTRIYMVDTGVRVSHSDFGGRAVKGRNFAPANVLNGNPPNAFEDYYNHGTPGAGVAIGTSYGVAPEAFLTDVRIFNDNGTTNYEAQISAIDWAANEVINNGLTQFSVINLSFGGVDTNQQDIVKYSVRQAIRNGIFVTVSAGNNRRDAAGYTPANVAEAFTVGGTDVDDNEYYYSNYGRFVDIWAPGAGYLAPSSASDTATKMVYGTSFSAPLVAGVSVLFKSFGYNTYSLSPQQLGALIQSVGTKNVLNLSTFPDDNPGPNILLYNNSTL